jgi:hypothetical protein
MNPVWRCLLTALLLSLALVITACGMTPYHNPNHREEGPERGLFTGSSGEWVIYRKEEAAPRSHGKHAETGHGDTALFSPDQSPSQK